MSTSSVVADLVADAQGFLDGGVAELAELLEGVAAYGERPVPAPSPELARLLAGRPTASTARPDRPRPTRVRLRGMVAGLAAAAVSGLSLTGAAAVANELPVPVQRVVAHFSEQYLPFSFPRPAGDLPAGRDTTRTRPEPGSRVPSAAPSAGPSAAPLGTSGGARAELRPRHPGTGRTDPHDRVRTTPKAGSPTTHRTATPPAGRDGTQGRGTAPAAPAPTTPSRPGPAGDPGGAAHGPAVGGSPRTAPPGTQDPPSPDPKGHLGNGSAHSHKGVESIGPGDQGGGSGGKPSGTGQDKSTGRGAGPGDLTTPKGSGASGADSDAKPGKGAAPSAGHASAAQDGSGAAT